MTRANTGESREPQKGNTRSKRSRGQSTRAQRAGAQSSGATPARGKPSKKKLITRVSVIVVLVAAVLAALVYFLPILTVGQVKVEGTRNADVQTIQKATGISDGTNMLRLDTKKAAANVAGVPWVEKVTVSRSWPTTVAVKITEHDPVGVLGSGKNAQVVDEQGHVFLKGAAPEGVAKFEKMKEQDAPALRAAATAVTSLPPEVRQRLEHVEAESAESVELFFRDGYQVHWGSAERADEKAEATRIVLTREEKHWNVSNPAMPSAKIG